MLVEDERVVAFDLKRQLQGFGYHVGAVVASGEQAILAVDGDRERPDLVLMDIHLEGDIDGIEAASTIRARYQIPVVFLTAYAEDDTLRRALDSRPFGYLVKPCEGRELHATIQMALARREEEMAVEQSEQRLKLALDAGALGVLEWSPSADRLQGDDHLGAFFGNQSLPLDEPWDTFIARVTPADRERVHRALNPISATGETAHFTFCTKGNHAPARYMEAHVKACGGARADGRVVGVLQDVTQRYHNEARLRQSSVVFQAAAEAIVIGDADGRIVTVNQAFTRITGYTEDEVVGLDPDPLLRITAGAERYAACLRAGQDGYWHGEVHCHRKSGEAFTAWQSISAVRNDDGDLSNIVILFSDVTAIHKAQNELHHLAHHDSLTGLPNRLLFEDRLQNAIAQARRNNRRCLLLFLDLDGFKVINDTLGHALGDELLRVTGERLRRVLRNSDTVARLGGDEFVVLAGSASPDYAAQLAQKILDQLRLPTQVAGESLTITASLGIALFPDNGADSQQLMRAADMAMYTAKSAGRNRYHFYAEDMSVQTRARMDVEQGLRRAIATDRLLVHYQPRVDLDGRRIVGVEALVRWQHPERGLVYPGDFIAIAEQSDIIEQIGRWVLHRSCGEMLALLSEATADGQFHLAVNVSVRQFLGDDFVGIVKSVLDDTGFPAHALELEITESVLQTTERSLLILRELDAIGVAVSIDDFGTGYSSLSVLRDLPIKRIKIDRSFIVDLPASDSQRAVVEAIVTLSRAMHMAITVEGVERLEQAEILQQLGCQEGQGYFFARPQPLASLMHLVRQGRLPVHDAAYSRPEGSAP
jgi:diguanylate cyclase (GGDEF)-like protein/PAS domain S-box-containing protein